MKLPSIEQMRADVSGRVILHLFARSVHDARAIEAAKRAVERWTEPRVKLVYVLTSESNRWWSLSAAGARVGVSTNAAKKLWSGLQRIVIDLPGEITIPLFRREVEMRFRHSGTVDGERVAGGVCLHLQQQPRMSKPDEDTITVTTAPALDVLEVNARASHTRQAEASAETTAAKETARQRKDRVIKGKVGGPQLKLVNSARTGTDDEGEE